MSIWLRLAIGAVVFTSGAARIFAGGSGLNVVVVANQNSPNSLQLANYYCEQRAVPPQNVLRINWAGGAIDWTRNDFETTLRVPLNAMLANRQLTSQIDYVLLSMDIPYRVTTSSDGANSTTSALFYGFKPDPRDLNTCPLAAGSKSLYAGSEGIFRQTPPISATSNAWLVMMLTASNLAGAKTVVDKGVASDSSFPSPPVYLIKNTDPFRSVRVVTFDDAVFDARLRNTAQVVRTNFSVNSSPASLGYQLGSQYGLVNIGILPTDLFTPGALADILTSFSGTLFEKNIYGHTTALDYMNAEATASYGTVVEPCNYLEKFASPRNYFYQARGFSAAECYYLSLTNPYQGILVGEPLAAPFAVPCSGVWNNLPAGALLVGNTNLAVQFTAADPARPIQQVDLFVDGTFAGTLTNLPPRQHNQLFLTINGHPTNYVVPANATLKSIASNLTAVVNASSYSNATKVAASAHGDRIELRSLDLAARGEALSLSVSNSVGNTNLLTTFIAASRTTFLDSIAYGFRNFLVTNAAQADSFLQLAVTKTNATPVTISVTNPLGNTDPAVLVQALVDAVNTNATLMTDDGVIAEDFFSYNVWFGWPAGEFNLRVRSPGWPESQIMAHLTGSANFNLVPAANVTVAENPGDLQPRDHLYLTAGLTNLSFNFGFDTTTQADGFHELTAVAYEGSHVRTQKRITQNVRIQNTPLSALFICLLCDTNTALEATLQFSVVANTGTISRIELFSTGGSWGVVNNQPSALFSVAATNLGAGLHPFYSVVTRADGKQYRTETKWIRLLENEPPFALAIAGSAPTLSWPATAGRRYEVLSAANVTDAFLLRDSVVPTNSLGLWSETNNTAPSQFYRVRSAP